MDRRLPTLLLLFFTFAGLSTQELTLQDLLPFLTTGDLNTLTQEGEISRLYDQIFAPQLVPHTPLGRDLRNRINSGQMNTGAELLFQVNPRPQGLEGKTETDQLLTLANTLRSLSTLQGIQYYSVSRKKVRTLFTESWRIADLDNTQALPDPLIHEFREGTEQYYIHQKDSSFGANQSVITYRQERPFISLSFLNKTTMYYHSTIKAVGPEKLQMHLLAGLWEDGLLVYAYCGGQAPNIGFLKRNVSTSFYNRLTALKEWLLKSLEG